jgi:small subunit ribosomal protein S17
MPRRILEGVVVSDKQDKTVTVRVERRFMHPIYKKYLKKSSKFSAHDEGNTAKEGEKIQIIECAPISKNKRWTVYTGQEMTAPKAEAAKPAEKKTEAKKAAPKKAAAKKKDDK